MADGNYRWQVYAVDAAGSVRPSRQRPWLHVDTAPPSAFSLATPADRAVSTVPTPSLCWYCTGDAAGVDHYELMIDGALSRSGIADPGASGNCGTSYAAKVCANPASALSEGAHTWKVRAVDKVGNAATSTETWTVVVDFNPPAAFSLISPGTDTGVVPNLRTATPTFTWQASSSGGSGLDHYELYVGGGSPNQILDLDCVECAIPPTVTSVTIAHPLEDGSHAWSVLAVDRLGGSTMATTGHNGFFLFDVACYGTCQSGPDGGPEPAPEPRPEPTVEPSRDAGVDVPWGTGPDAPLGTSTSTGTRTAGATGTSTATSTGTSVAVEPRSDGSVLGGIDAVVAIGDAGSLADSSSAATGDAAVNRQDASMVDAASSATDATSIRPAGDSSATYAYDAKAARSDGGGVGGGGVIGKNGSSGCGCVVGGANADARSGLIAFVGLVVLWGLGRRRARTRKEG